MQTYILVREYVESSPLITLYTNYEQAEAAYNRHVLLNYPGVRTTLFESKMDSLGFDQACELRSMDHRKAVL